jgi:hypothetical protein
MTGRPCGGTLREEHEPTTRREPGECPVGGQGCTPRGSCPGGVQRASVAFLCSSGQKTVALLIHTSPTGSALRARPRSPSHTSASGPASTGPCSAAGRPAGRSDWPAGRTCRGPNDWQGAGEAVEFPEDSTIGWVRVRLSRIDAPCGDQCMSAPHRSVTPQAGFKSETAAPSECTDYKRREGSCASV